ncbi:hypothetical protein D3C78_1200070 [compost metagenome]
MDQVVELGNLAVRIGDDGEVDLGVLGFVDVVDPLHMGGDRVHRKRQDLHAALGEVVLELGGQAEFGGADRSEIRRVGEQHAPAVAEPVMEAKTAGAGFLFEVGGNVAESEAHEGHSLFVVGSLCTRFKRIKKNRF